MNYSLEAAYNGSTIAAQIATNADHGAFRFPGGFGTTAVNEGKRFLRIVKPSDEIGTPGVFLDLEKLGSDFSGEYRGTVRFLSGHVAVSTHANSGDIERIVAGELSRHPANVREARASVRR